MILNWNKFLESVGNVPISDIHSYIEGMEAGYVDKLFFLDKIDPDVIVDFGCADGTILSKIKNVRPNVKLIGYDLDSNMLLRASKKLGENAILSNSWSEIISEVSKYERPAVVLSSVIHEVYSYSHSSVIKKFWESQIFGDKFKWICIRDMIPSTSMYKHNHREFINDVKKVKLKANKHYLESFENKWGEINNNYRTFIHFLLKYKYTDNWDREVNENYVPVTLETLYKKIPSNYKIIYQDNFILPSLLDQVKKDFDIKIDHTTHTKMIIENETFNMKYLKKFENYSTKNYQISDIDESDIDGILDICVEAFGDLESSDEIKEYLKEKTDWSISKKATIGDKIVGCYLLNEESVIDFLKDSDCSLENLSQYENKRGIQGIGLVVVPEYQKLGIGKEMRSIPLNMEYDYIWGQHLKGLHNIKHWTDFGRRIVADGEIDGEEMYVTLMDIN